MARPLSQSLEEHLIPWRQLPWPIDWSQVFGREAPLSLEIGFGNGGFLARQAAAHPELNHVGIELSWAGATRLFKRLNANGAQNAKALLVDAEVALQHLFRSNSLERAYVIHPCPWPKARHMDRRVLNPAGLAQLASRMGLGKQLTVITDHAEYAEWLGEVLAGQDTLQSIHPTIEVAEIPGHEPTKYQRKAMAEGIPIHFFEWKKVLETQVPDPPSIDPETMPSIKLEGPYEAKSLAAKFTPQTFREVHQGEEVIVRLNAAFQRADDGALLIEALVQEGRLKHEFSIFVGFKRPDVLIVKLGSMGRPHPTHGVRRALQCASHWLQEAAPGLRVAHENLGAELAD